MEPELQGRFLAIGPPGKSQILLFSILSLPPPEPHLLSIGGLGAFSLEPGNSGHRLGHELPHFSQERISQLDEAPSDAQ